jgi:hypothetical protein
MVINFEKDSEGFFSAATSFARRVELLIRERKTNQEIYDAIPTRPPKSLAQYACRLRTLYGYNLVVGHKHGVYPRRITYAAHEAIPVDIPVAEIKRLHFERKVPFTHIASLLKVPYKDISKVIAGASQHI